MGRQFPALRGVAILLVVLNHSITLSLEAVRKYGYSMPSGVERYGWVALKEFGLIAVPTFLFLSGCFLAYALRGKELKAAYKTVWSGLRYIVAPYVIWSLVFYVMLYFLDRTIFPWPEYIKHLLVGYPYNFVPLLIFFYLLAPVLVRVGGRYPWLVILAFGLYQLFLANVLKPGLLGFAFPDWARYFALPGLRLSLAIWGIYFPLGTVYSLHSKSLLPRLAQARWLLAAAAVAAYGLAALHELSFVEFPLAELLCPVFVMLLFPLVKRESIPFAQHLEQIGKNALGLYLTNLITLSITLAIVGMLLPGLFGLLLLLIPALFIITIFAPRLLIAALARLPIPAAQRYVFG
jgi:peptidoglycan/LPS O-acetylase OafA/YrhL